MEVQVSSLNLTYGDVTAVTSLDLHIPDGESVVLLGQSGCGKTSTMRCIAGLEEPTRGMIRIGDRVVFDSTRGVNVPAYKRNVGMVFQSYAVWPHRTVAENVAFPIRRKGVAKSEARRKALSILETVGLAHLADRGASMLSGGQMQRVALARSIAMEPSVLLLDEPLSNLDARLRDDLRVELRRIQLEEGLTSLYVTHDQHEAFALADKVAIMQSGYITQLADPTTLYRSPASASIASFIGVSNVFSIAGIDAAGNATLRDHALQIRTQSDPLRAPSSLCIRPEAITVRPDADADDRPASSTTQVGGTVMVSVFQGATVRYQVALDDGPAVEAIVSSSSGHLLPTGSRVRVQIAAADVAVLVDDVVPTQAEAAA